MITQIILSLIVLSVLVYFFVDFAKYRSYEKLLANFLQNSNNTSTHTHLHISCSNGWNNSYVVRSAMVKHVEFTLRKFSNEGSFAINAQSFEIKYRNVSDGEFRLITSAGSLATAYFKKFFKPMMTVLLPEAVFIIEDATFSDGQFLIRQQGQVVGAITSAEAWIPNTISTPCQIFILWLAAIMWRRLPSGSVAA